jgi:hypothetical protein
MKTDQPGHWYKCKGATCQLRIPLPDKIFREAHHDELWEAECKCGHMNTFKYSEAGDKTTKVDVDKYFDIKDPRGKFTAYWGE